MIKGAIVIPRVWRAELSNVAMFVVFSILSIVLSRQYPWSVISGHLFTIGNSAFYLNLPLFWFLPLFPIGKAIYQIYNVKYIVDSRGVELRVGILSLRQRVVRVRYEDIRIVEKEQTISERILDIGTVEIGTAATGSIEIIFSGVAAPQEVQDMIQSERDRRQKLARQASRTVVERATA
ncbi:MAG: PH domain-containing protein [Candidatus Dadabacteria bacterium]|nr:MAG: PH domain-containing protein [Candidatus Dadabacteria bacterium]